MGYIFLLLTILSETAAVIFMKLSAGFQNKWYAVFAAFTYGLSFVMLTLSLKYLPAGITNAVWAGASTLLVAVLGIVLFQEKLTTVQVISLCLVVVGLAGLTITKPAT